MFLMAEGERIWFWRNRTENERWFWDIFAWDRLIFREWRCNSGLAAARGQSAGGPAGRHRARGVCARACTLARPSACGPAAPRPPLAPHCPPATTACCRAAILCTVAYQYIVPNHLLWVVVVPMVFIMWQTGRIPGPLDLEFWLIMYFGVYKKCWADVVGVARALFLWA